MAAIVPGCGVGGVFDERFRRRLPVVTFDVGWVPPCSVCQDDVVLPDE
jgi:hypothetical protein